MKKQNEGVTGFLKHLVVQRLKLLLTKAGLFFENHFQEASSNEICDSVHII